MAGPQGSSPALADVRGRGRLGGPSQPASPSPLAAVDEVLDEVGAVGLLGLKEESSHPRRERCERWPLSLKLKNSATGEVVEGRCKSTNLCSYCARLGSIELAETLALDAVEHFGPEVWACVGTRTPESDPKPFYRARECLQRAIRRRWPDAEIANLREFTTGYGPRSGGARRPHWNLLTKGVPRDQVEEFESLVKRVWCARVDAEPDAQHVGTVYEAGGLSRYLGLHFLKESQAPPKGWRGHRFTSSRGYFAEGAKAARERARESLRLKTEVWKLQRWADENLVELSHDELWGNAVWAVMQRSAVDWDLVHVLPESGDPGTRRWQVAADRRNVGVELRKALGLTHGCIQNGDQAGCVG